MKLPGHEAVCPYCDTVHEASLESQGSVAPSDATEIVYEGAKEEDAEGSENLDIKIYRCRSCGWIVALWLNDWDFGDGYYVAAKKIPITDDEEGDD